MQMKNYNCLMIKTKDQRKFFTHNENFELLIEFSKVFKAEISQVKVEEADVLELEDLSIAFCNNYENKKSPKYKVLNIKMPQSLKSRKEILTNAKKVSNYIKRQLLRGKEVSLKELKKKFEILKLTNACFCTHFAKVRDELQAEGYEMIKLKGGTYKIKINKKSTIE